MDSGLRRSDGLGIVVFTPIPTFWDPAAIGLRGFSFQARRGMELGRGTSIYRIITIYIIFDIVLSRRDGDGKPRPMEIGIMAYYYYMRE